MRLTTLGKQLIVLSCLASLFGSTSKARKADSAFEIEDVRAAVAQSSLNLSGEKGRSLDLDDLTDVGSLNVGPNESISVYDFRQIGKGCLHPSNVSATFISKKMFRMFMHNVGAATKSANINIYQANCRFFIPLNVNLLKKKPYLLGSPAVTRNFSNGFT